MKSAALFAAVAGLAIASPAIAAGMTLSNNVMVQQRSIAADGTAKIALVPAARVTPGDRVTFQIAYHNGDSRPAEGLVLNNPIPSELSYRGPAQGSPAPDVSLDGKTFGPLASLSAHDAHGATRAARAEDVTHVRWRIAQAVPAGGSGKVAFDAQIK